MYLLRRFARSNLQVLLVCGAIAAAASLIRLLPWLASRSVPRSTAGIFAQALLLASFEVALLIAPALGTSLEIARATAEGTTTALFSLGVGPARQVGQVAIAAGAAGLLSLAVSTSWGLRASHPGLLTNDVLNSGRLVCADRRPAQAPLVGITWVCLDDRPTMVGLLGSSTSPAGVWTASSGWFSPDLSSVELTSVRAWFRSGPVHSEFAQVTVSGLLPWIVASPIPALLRGVAWALVCLLSAIASAWVLLQHRCTSRAVAVAVGASGPAVFLVLAPRMLGTSTALALLGTTAIALATPLVTGLALSRLRLLAALRGDRTR